MLSKYIRLAAATSITILASCASERPAGPTSEQKAEHREIGKADAPGSCQSAAGDSCGGPSDGACWCDPLCEEYHDCCADYAAVCLGEPSTPTVVRSSWTYADVPVLCIFEGPQGGGETHNSYRLRVTHTEYGDGALELAWETTHETISTAPCHGLYFPLHIGGSALFAEDERDAVDGVETCSVRKTPSSPLEGYSVELQYRSEEAQFRITRLRFGRVKEDMKWTARDHSLAATWLDFPH